jgi:hemolysin D
MNPHDSSSSTPAANAPVLRHPIAELLGRYRAVFRAAWAHRDELAGPRRMADETAFLPAALSLQETPVHPAPRRLAFGLIALFLIALAWSIFGQVDIVAVAPGRIIVSERTKLVQPLEASVVKRVLVKDGDRVEAGQPLIELDSTGAAADRSSIGEQLKSAESEVMRTRILQRSLEARARSAAAPAPALESDAISAASAWSSADVGAARAQLDAEWSDVVARLAKSAAEISHRQSEIATVREMIGKLEATLPIARKREADFKQLADEGFMSSHANQDRMRERIEMERDLATQRARLAEVNAAWRESENNRAAWRPIRRRAMRRRAACC